MVFFDSIYFSSQSLGVPNELLWIISSPDNNRNVAAIIIPHVNNHQDEDGYMRNLIIFAK